MYQINIGLHMGRRSTLLSRGNDYANKNLARHGNHVLSVRTFYDSEPDRIGRRLNGLGFATTDFIGRCAGECAQSSRNHRHGPKTGGEPTAGSDRDHCLLAAGAQGQ